jgi:1-acyl-sn-glycerol-3-phosphate acyltransferase
VPPSAPLAYRAAFRWPLVPLAALYRLQITGAAHLPQAGGCVVSANQHSNLDSWLVAAAVEPRPVRFMGKAELFRRPFAPALRAVGVFGVRRDQVDRAALEQAVDLARSGAVVGIFVEGTRRRKGFRKRRLARPHDGAAWVALRAGVPLVPIAISGTDRLLRLRRWRVAVGEQIDLGAGSSRIARRLATARLWDAIRALEATR